MSDHGDRHEHGARLSRGGRVHITVASEEGGKPFALAVPHWLFKVALGLAAVLTVLIIGGGVLTARMGAELRRLHEIEEENAALRAENRKIDALARELAELDALREQILFLAGAGRGKDAGVDKTGKDAGVGKTGKDAGRVTATPERPAGPPLRSQLAGGGASELRRSVPAEPIPLLPPSMRRGPAPKGSPASSPAPVAGPPGSPSLPQWPVDGVVSRAFALDTTPERRHHGIDIAAPHGTPVRAAGSGVVTFAEMDSVFGRLIVIDHGEGWQTVYGHNSRLVVGIGDSVRTGEEIAQVGSTGESSAPHLHFEVRRGGRPVDPRRYVGR
jgi:murein DD-endopeptidase MepM/ murein hydrolase activator NlpD